jgi:hypothetical protein
MDRRKGIHHVQGIHPDEALGSARIRTMCFIGYAAPWPQLIALTYNNRMNISLSVFRSQFSLQAAQDFLNAFIEEITREN